LVTIEKRILKLSVQIC